MLTRQRLVTYGIPTAAALVALGRMLATRDPEQSRAALGRMLATRDPEQSRAANYRAVLQPVAR